MTVMTNSKLSQLALHGGQPVRSTWLPYAKQTIDQSDKDAILKVLDSDWLTRGPAVTQFERTVADLVGMPEAVAFSSATAALHAVMSMLKVNDGKRVITSPITFAATANSVRYCDGKVIFSDIEDSTMNLDIKLLSDLKATDIVVPVDFGGNPCDYDHLRSLQNKNGFRIVADAAHSFGGAYKKSPVGALADITVLSFHPVKSMTTGEGGLVLLKDKAEGDYLRAFRSHGIVRSSKSWIYSQEFLGFNYNITDLQCALGLAQLKRLPDFIKRRRELVAIYNSKLNSVGEFILPKTTEGSESAWHLYPIRLKLSHLTCNRDDFLSALHAENIGANVHYVPVYRHPYYQKLGYSAGLCPRAEAAYSAEISLPLFPGMSPTDVHDVCIALQKVLDAYKKP